MPVREARTLPVQKGGAGATPSRREGRVPPRQKGGAGATPPATQDAIFMALQITVSKIDSQHEIQTTTISTTGKLDKNSSGRMPLSL